MRFLIFCLMLSFPVRMEAQSKPWMLTAELDPLPYLTGGYFAALTAGTEQWRGRVLVADVNMPPMIYPERFGDFHVLSLAALLDYYPAGREDGFWYAAGLVHWDGSIRHEDSGQTARWSNWLVNASMGYLWNWNSRLAFSPWAGVSARVAGPSAVTVGSTRFRSAALMPEASLKMIVFLW